MEKLTEAVAAYLCRHGSVGASPLHARPNAA